MYSLMSMRTIADSSSNRKAASALVSSVLPTPVGPRKMNEPMGRLGSCSPARARLTAVRRPRPPPAGRPRLGQRVLHAQQLVALTFQHAVDRNTGPARDDLGDVIGRDGLLHHRAVGVLALDRLELFLQPRNDAIGQLAGTAEIAAALRLRQLGAALVEDSTLSFWASPSLLFSPSHRRVSALDFSSSVAISLSRRASRSLEAASLSFFSASRSIASASMSRSMASSSSGLESISILSARRRPRRSGRWPCRAGTGR